MATSDRARALAGRALRAAVRRSGARTFFVRQLGRLVGSDSRLVEHQRYQDVPEVPVAVDIAEWMAFRGQLFVDATIPAVIAGSRVEAAAVRFESETWERAVRPGERNAWTVPIPASQASPAIGLGLRCADGRCFVITDPAAVVVARNSFHSPYAAFAAILAELDGGLVVELGSRDRSGRINSDLVPRNLEYLGIDIAEGPNVDLVGDAHELSSLLAPGSVEGIFSIATFEHLAMPWRCAVEMNKVLKLGGVCFVMSHQTFPLHETPWDFFRFSDSAWRALFNEATGFEILDVAMGEPAGVAALALTPITWNMDRAAAYLGSAVTCRKIGEAKVDWPVSLDLIERTAYPG